MLNLHCNERRTGEPSLFGVYPVISGRILYNPNPSANLVGVIETDIHKGPHSRTHSSISQAILNAVSPFLLKLPVTFYVAMTQHLPRISSEALACLKVP